MFSDKDSLAIQLKLNELLAAHESASNRPVNVENMCEEDLRVIQKFYTSLSKMAKNGESSQQTHSIDEAGSMSKIKQGREEIIKEELDAKKPN